MINFVLIEALKFELEITCLENFKCRGKIGGIGGRVKSVKVSEVCRSLLRAIKVSCLIHKFGSQIHQLCGPIKLNMV